MIIYSQPLQNSLSQNRSVNQMVVQCSQMFANIKYSINVFNEYLLDVCGDSSKCEKRLCLAGRFSPRGHHLDLVSFERRDLFQNQTLRYSFLQFSARSLPWKKDRQNKKGFFFQYFEVLPLNYSLNYLTLGIFVKFYYLLFPWHPVEQIRKLLISQ